MNRILEPELMEDEAQVKAYAEADFEEPHSRFIERLATFLPGRDFDDVVLDLGCGSADIGRRFAKRYPNSRIHGVDGSAAMLAYARLNLPATLQSRILLLHGKLPDIQLPKTHYRVIIANSLLHHLPDPMVLWHFIERYARAGTLVAVQDLLRPGSLQEAQKMVRRYARHEASILQRDFFNSLLAAFSIDEINSQLAAANLPFTPEPISDRHVFITGLIT
jgi:trans-aconitate methyltransferase